MRRRRALLGCLLSTVIVSLLPAPANADTVDPAPVRSFTAHQGWGVGVSPATGLIYAPDDTGTVHVYSPAASGASPGELFSFAVPPGGNECLAAPDSNRPWSPVFDATGHNLAITCVGLVGLYTVDASGGATYRGAISGLSGLTSVVFDPEGKLLVAARNSTVITVYDVSVLPATPTGFVNVVGLSSPLGLALAGDELYVADTGTNKVQVVPYPGGSVPVRTLTLPDFTEVDSVQVDSAGNTYVSGFTGGVFVFAPGSTGAATPVKQLTGPTSGLFGGQTSMVIDAQRNIYVSQLDSPGRYTTFAPLFPLPQPPAVSPGAVTGLKVAGKKADKKRTISWAAGPAGSSPVTTYAVTVTKGSKTLLNATTTAAAYTLKAKKLKKSGKYTVTVVATSQVGTGAPVSATFKVKLKKKHHHKG
jgi:hypothetical protein